MKTVFEKPHALTDIPFHYCPGCTHGIVHRLVAEVLDELGIEGQTVGIAPVGCSVFAYNYFNCDMIEAPHGTSTRRCDGSKARQPRQDSIHISGRRRPCRNRHRRDRPRRRKRRKYHRNIHQQRHLRHDRRSDGAHNPARSGHNRPPPTAEKRRFRATLSAYAKWFPPLTAPHTSNAFPLTA